MKGLLYLVSCVAETFQRPFEARRRMCQVVNAGIHPSLVDTFGRRCLSSGLVWVILWVVHVSEIHRHHSFGMI